jgi:hypothetical protein
MFELYGLILIALNAIFIRLLSNIRIEFLLLIIIYLLLIKDLLYI